MSCRGWPPRPPGLVKPMPIYEYRCNACRKRVSVFQRQISTSTAPVCPNCGGSDLRRLVSRFAVVRTEDQMLDSLDDDSLLSGVDEDDPRSVAAWARKMQSKMGEEVEPEFEEMIDRMEAGEMPDEFDGEEGDLPFDGE
jgi:putative FmdB family regulatory protein